VSRLAGAGAGRGWLAAAGAIAGSALAVEIWRRAAERRHPPIGRFVEVDGVRLHVHARGEGPPVLLLSGNGTLADDWEACGLMDRLAPRYRAIAVDRPGYGYSHRPRDRLWTASAQAALLVKAMRALGIVRPVVVGHSWGALTAAALAVEHGSALRGAVLLSGYYFPTGRMDVWLFSPPAIPVLGDVLRHTIGPPAAALMAKRLVPKMFAPRPVPRAFVEEFPLPLAFRPGQLRASAENSAFMVPRWFRAPRRSPTATAASPCRWRSSPGTPTRSSISTASRSPSQAPSPARA
jgi:pimeloyl-ACP methyl ester carboxylesterase